MDTIAMVSPGAMGSALGRGYVDGGARVVATVAGRSRGPGACARSPAAAHVFEAVIAEADIVISVVHQERHLRRLSRSGRWRTGSAYVPLSWTSMRSRPRR